MKFSKFHRIILRSPTILSAYSFFSTNCGTILSEKSLKYYRIELIMMGGEWKSMELRLGYWIFWGFLQMKKVDVDKKKKNHVKKWTTFKYTNELRLHENIFLLSKRKTICTFNYEKGKFEINYLFIVTITKVSNEMLI